FCGHGWREVRPEPAITDRIRRRGYPYRLMAVLPVESLPECRHYWESSAIAVWAAGVTRPECWEALSRLNRVLPPDYAVRRQPPPTRDGENRSQFYRTVGSCWLAGIWRQPKEHN